MTEERPLAAGLVARRSINRLEIVAPGGAPELVFTRLAGPDGRSGIASRHPSLGHTSPGGRGFGQGGPAPAGGGHTGTGHTGTGHRVPAPAGPGHIAAGLAFGGGRMCVDVTIQPGAIVRQLDQAAAEQAVDANRWRRAVLAELADWSGHLDWCPAEPDRLTAAIGALGHPLLRHVYERGLHPLDEIPRWAVPALRTGDAMAAARTLHEGATRRLARALAASLVARPVPGPVELEPLAWGVIAGGLVSADELANLLERPVAERPQPLPTGEQIAEARRSLELWPAPRRGTLLLGAATAVGPVDFTTTMRKVWWIRDRTTRTLPVNWADLTRLCLELVPMVYDDRADAPAPATVGAARAGTARRRAARTAAPAPDAAATAAALVLDELFAGATLVAPDALPAAAPAARSPRRRAAARPPDIEAARPALTVRDAPEVDLLTRWSVPRGLAPVQGLHCGPVRLEVPTSVAQLRHWGQLLHNCLGSFGPAVVAGRSWLVGIMLGESLIGCVEVETRRRTVRQILAARNEPLPAELRDPVLDALHRLGIVR